MEMNKQVGFAGSQVQNETGKPDYQVILVPSPVAFQFEDT